MTETPAEALTELMGHLEHAAPCADVLDILHRWAFRAPRPDPTHPYPARGW